MEPDQITIAFLSGLSAGILVTYLILKAYTISRNAHEELKGKLIDANRELDAQRIIDKRLPLVVGLA